MIQAWNSFLQTVFQFVKSLFVNVSKKMHRDAVVLTAGVMVVTVVPFTAGDFQGGGRNALVAFAETPGETLSETDGEETDLDEADGNLPTAEEEQSEELPETADSGENNFENEETKDEVAVWDATDEDAADVAGAEEDMGIELLSEEEAERIELSDRDYQVLLKIVQAEAGGCDQKGRILVANVILNRVESDEFPDSVSGVVYERHQFSPVSDGSLDRCKVSQETVEAVEAALAGEDYSEGALYFMNRRTASGKNVRWFDNHLDYLFKHGSHEFFK